MTLLISDLMALKQIDLICDVHCVTGWTLLDSRWRGISMKTLINLVKVKETAGFVIFEAPGVYASSIPLAEALKDNVILAHGFYDRKLPQAHGAPLRALIPDRFFTKVLNGSKASNSPPLMSRDIMKVRDTATALIHGRKNGSISHFFGNLKINGMPTKPMAALIK